MYHDFQNNIKLFSQMMMMMMMIINVSWAINQCIRMISGLYDTEEWSNDADNSAFRTEE